MRIVADRFGVMRDGRAIDLSTGSPVLLRIGVAGGVTEQARWANRCGWLYGMHHRRLAALVDYGALGEAHRFEAWRCGAEWRRAPSDSTRAIRGAAWFLGACERTVGAISAADVYDCEGNAVVVLPPASGYPRDSSGSTTIEYPRGLADAASLENCGIWNIDRRADAALADLFVSVSGSRPYVVSVWGGRGSGRRTATRHAARMARLNGFVPIGVQVMNEMAELNDVKPIGMLTGRHLCLLSGGGPAADAAALLRATLASPRIHLLLQFGAQEPVWPGALHNVALERVPLSRLIAAVRPDALAHVAGRRIECAARKAHGLPARFADLLWGTVQCAQREPSRHSWGPPSDGPIRRKTGPACFGAGSRVAEQPSPYSVGELAAPQLPGGSRRCGWPEAGELPALRRRAEAATELLKKGRHAPAIRQLRQVIGGLSRRGAWTDVASAVLPLASALLARGDPRGSLAAIEESRARLEEASGESLLGDLAVVSGHAWIDTGRLDEAESVIAAALTVACRVGDAARTAQLSVALGRCLFWKGRYAESCSALTSRGGESDQPAIRVSLLAGRARATVGLGDVAGAMSLAREATEAAFDQSDPGLRARACAAAAFVHLAAGDLDAVDQDVTKCLAAAREDHDPMRTIRARLLLAESDRRRGRPSSSSTFIRRLRRAAPRRLPAIVRARVEMIHALLESSSSAEEIVSRHAARSGLRGLLLYGPNSNRGRSPHLFADSCTEELVGILNVCQTVEDEAHALGEVCVRTRRQLHAAAVAVVIRDQAGASHVAADGPRLDPATATRVLESGVSVLPHRIQDCLESAAPVRYGGAVIGALAVRWPLGNPYDLSGVAGILTTVATVIAPVVSSLMARRSAPTPSALDGLLGLTAPIMDLRRAIECAARAPFAVLIEGESGSGKELVAKAVHRLSSRRDRPLCTLNCAALPDDLVEAELFGHARGAFTGAVHERAGVFEEAHGGTLLLDEVGELSARAQAKLLRVIQEGELRRIGENGPRRVDVRVVSATNRDLRNEVAAGRFRLDLLYRLDVIRLAVPPLRERRDDIALLADHFWREAAMRVGSRAVLAAATTAALARYDWPGNIRELQNVLASLAVRAPRRGMVTPVALPPQFGASPRAETCRLDEARRTFDARFIRAALLRSGGHRGRAAAELGVTRQGLTKLLARLGID